MRKIYYNLEIGYCGCNDEGTTEVPDDMTNDEIDSLVYDMAYEHAQSWIGDQRLGFGNEDEDQDEVEQMFLENVCGSWRDATNED